jgi:chloramphenicol-sensitive protein RarD
VLTYEAGGLPWVSLFLAITFAIYGYLRKTLPIGPSQGFFLEVLILFAPAFGYIVWLGAAGNGHFVEAGTSGMGLLMLAGRPVSIASGFRGAV